MREALKYLRATGVVRGPSDPYIAARIGDGKFALPDVLANYDPSSFSNPWRSSFYDAGGDRHDYNLRVYDPLFKGEFHITTDVGRNGLFVHFDAHPASENAYYAYKHWKVEVPLDSGLTYKETLPIDRYFGYGNTDSGY